MVIRPSKQTAILIRGIVAGNGWCGEELNERKINKMKEGWSMECGRDLDEIEKLNKGQE